MSNEGSGSKWIVGCLVAGVLMLLVCGGGLALLGFVGYRTANQVGQSISTGIQQQAEQMQFASAWLAPQPGAGPDVLFPENVNAWRLASHDDDAPIVELGIERDGRHARYESGVTGIDVYAYEVPAVEQAALFQDAASAIEAVNYTTRVQSHIDDGTSHRMTFEFSPPETYGRMWWCRGWLFVLKSDNSTLDLDAFQTQYLSAVAGLAAAEVSGIAETAAPDMVEEVTTDDAIAPDAVLDPGGETAPGDPTSPAEPD